MALNSGIILAGVAPDVVGSMARGTEAGLGAARAGRENALARLYQTQGDRVLAGDREALNALARLSPDAAMGVQSNMLGMEQTRLGMDATRLGMDQTRQNMAFNREEMEMRRAAAAESARAAAAQMTAEQRAAAAAEIENGLKGAAPYFQSGDKAGYNQWLSSQGIDPAQYPFEQFPSHAAQLTGVLDTLKSLNDMAPKPLDPLKGAPSGYMFNDPANPAAGVSPLPGYDDGKGQIETVYGPDGQPILTRGPAGSAGGGSNKQVFDTMKESADSAASARTGLRALANAKVALEGENGAITGFGADTRLGLAKLGALMGVTDPNIIQNTETFRSAIAPQVAAMIKATVGSAQISNADREFAEKAAGGSIALDAGTITRLIGIMETASNAIIDRHEEKLNRVYPPGQGFDRERALFGISDPVSPAGGGKDFSTMGVAEIGQVDIMNLSPAEMDALEARMQELGL